MSERRFSELRFKILTKHDQALMDWMSEDTLYPQNKRQMVMGAIRAFWNPMMVAQAGASSQEIKLSAMAAIQVLEDQVQLLRELAGLEQGEAIPVRSRPVAIDSKKMVDEKITNSVSTFW
jgi:hypothetical protein